MKTTDSRHRFPRYPNLIKDTAISRLNQAWFSDITCISIKTGFVYLAPILDAYSRRVIGYAVSTSLDTALTLKALRRAIAEPRLQTAASRPAVPKIPVPEPTASS